MLEMKLLEIVNENGSDIKRASVTSCSSDVAPRVSSCAMA